jgi:predicted DNA-binding protein (MmcQ/YjbR family)
VNFDTARAFLGTHPDVIEDFPFGPHVHVFKVSGRMFATLGPGTGTAPARMNLKCDPEEALILRDVFDAVLPGYHMNKAHWNTIVLDGTIPRGELERMIENSFALVVGKLPRAKRIALGSWRS